jgi:ent-copalyl diphosphate synthase
MWRLGEEDPEEMPIGFEIAFPSLLETAKSLDIVFPYDHHALQSIYATREVKLKKYVCPHILLLPTYGVDNILHANG